MNIYNAELWGAHRLPEEELTVEPLLIFVDWYLPLMFSLSKGRDGWEFKGSEFNCSYFFVLIYFVFCHIQYGGLPPCI